MSITEHYIPIMDKKGNLIYDIQTGKVKYRLGSKTVVGNVYSDYIRNDEKKRFQGINLIRTLQEKWKYDEKGNRMNEKKIEGTLNTQS